MKLDYKNSTSDVLPEGTYETVIRDACFDSTLAGEQCIKIEFKVRSDVDQKYQNSIIWHRLYKAKNPSPQDMACDGYRAVQINALSRAAAFADGAEFESMADWMQHLTGRMVKLEARHEPYNGKIYVRVGKMMQSEYPDIQFADAALLNEEELPF